MKFSDYSGRSHDMSIYRQDWISSNDSHDMDKVDKGKIKTTKGSERGNLVQLKKQKERNFK